ncbi:MAG: hypothetical protein ACM36C_08195 [Acidobacteriota bacterium]
MSILDWSDAEEMLGLLAEYVSDELHGESVDRQRVGFLRTLSSAVESLASHAVELSTPETIARLRCIHDSQPAEFAGDVTLVHVRDCIQELERILAQTPPE